MTIGDPMARPGAPSGPARPARPPEQVEVTLLAVEGPIWLPPESPGAELFPTKADDAALIAFLGGSVEFQPGTDPARTQAMAKALGRLAQALPLFLAEQVELGTTALARTLVPWMVKPRPGYILGGTPWDDATASRHARAVSPDDPADYLVVCHLRCRTEPWTVELRLVRTADATCLATFEVPCPSADPGSALPAIHRALLDALAREAKVEPIPVPLALGPTPAPASRYLIALEQLLTLRTATLAPGASSLAVERAILEAQCEFCSDQPSSLPLRLLLANTLAVLKRTRPELPPEFRDTVRELHTLRPLPEPAHSVVARMLEDAVG